MRNRAEELRRTPRGCALVVNFLVKTDKAILAHEVMISFCMIGDGLIAAFLSHYLTRCWRAGVITIASAFSSIEFSRQKNCIGYSLTFSAYALLDTLFIIAFIRFALELISGHP
jgi:hypothetical protein